jgi:hypothetical protein
MSLDLKKKTPILIKTKTIRMEGERPRERVVVQMFPVLGRTARYP